MGREQRGTLQRPSSHERKGRGKGGERVGGKKSSATNKKQRDVGIHQGKGGGKEVRKKKKNCRSKKNLVKAPRQGDRKRLPKGRERKERRRGGGGGNINPTLRQQLRFS